MIQEITLKCKATFLKYEKRLATAGIVILGILFVLGLAKVSKIENSRPAIRIVDTSTNLTNAVNFMPEKGTGDDNSRSATVEPRGAYVASKSGKRYYLPDCAGVSRIKEENKVWFKTKVDAESRGYSPAANCKGI